MYMVIFCLENARGRHYSASVPVVLPWKLWPFEYASHVLDWTWLLDTTQLYLGAQWLEKKLIILTLKGETGFELTEIIFVYWSPVRNFPEVFFKTDFNHVPFSPYVTIWNLIWYEIWLNSAVNQMMSKVSSSSKFSSNLIERKSLQVPGDSCNKGFHSSHVIWGQVGIQKTLWGEVCFTLYFEEK